MCSASHLLGAQIQSCTEPRSAPPTPSWALRGSSAPTHSTLGPKPTPRTAELWGRPAALCLQCLMLKPAAERWGCLLMHEDQGCTGIRAAREALRPMQLCKDRGDENNTVFTHCSPMLCC